MTKNNSGIRKIAKDVYEVRPCLGYDPIARKYIKPSRTVHGSLADARKVRDELVEAHKHGLRPDADKITFGDWSKDFIENKVLSGALCRKSADRQRLYLRNLNAYLSNVKLCDISPQVVESLLISIKADKVKERGHYSNNSLIKDYQLLKQILQKAVDYDYLLKNPCDKVKPPKKEPVDRNSLTEAEMLTLVRKLDQKELSLYSAFNEKEARQISRGNLFGRESLRGLGAIGNVIAVRIALATGFRRGEVFGLVWDAVDLQDCSIKVVQSQTDYGDRKTPKTKAGIRTVAVDAVTVAHLKKWLVFQKRELAKIGIKQTSHTPVCCSDVGGFMDLHDFGRWWRDFRAECELEGHVFHEIRHTQATFALANGASVKDVQNRLGHASASTTLDMYAHAMPAKDREIADSFGSIFARSETPVIVLEEPVSSDFDEDLTKTAPKAACQ